MAHWPGTRHFHIWITPVHSTTARTAARTTVAPHYSFFLVRITLKTYKKHITGIYQGYFGPQRIASRYPTAVQSLALSPFRLTIRLSLRLTIRAPTIRETDRCFNELAGARHSGTHTDQRSRSRFFLAICGYCLLMGRSSRLMPAITLSLT
jgi:hypothetical protein